MEGFAYFPAIIYRDERPDLVGKVLGACLRRLEEVRQPERTFNQTVYLGQDPALREVSDYLLVSSVGFLKDQGYNVEKYDFHLSGLWAQELSRGAGTDVHLHRNSQVCGWFFLETPQGGSFPIYHDTRANKAMIELDFVQGDEISNATRSVYFNNVQPGTVMFGNSWMHHQLSPNQTETPTRCIHFIISHKDRPCSTC
jgi:uncharacterized protein (TIGR02466 family)